MLIQRYFCPFYGYVEKADLNKRYHNSKRKLGVTAHFSETTELKFRNKIPYILCYFKAFLEL